MTRPALSTRVCGIIGSVVRVGVFGDIEVFLHLAAGPLLAALLIFPTLGMAAAPFDSWAAQGAALPQDLRERRRTEYRRSGQAFTAAAAAAAGGAVALSTSPASHPRGSPSS
ncbi:MAG TPA: hypothetical protein VMA72_27390 [Streptosporangiaceae bacterium]|nr:hypothetical protein [Streptosporangiaceae bacterium]